MCRQIGRVLYRGFQFLGNLSLAIFLLLIIAIVSSFGTFIEQNRSVSFYEVTYSNNHPIFGFLDANAILSFGLDHVYTSSWFLLLIFLFGSSLMSCTLSRQVPALKLSKLWQFLKYDRHFVSSELLYKLDNISLNEFSYLLRQENYNVLQQGSYIYAYKGLLGKIGPIFVHFSIILILIGSLFGSFFGFTLQQLIIKGDSVHLQNIITSGIFSYIPQDIQIYTKDFKIAYSDEGVIDQFYSDIAILDSSLKTQVKKTIFVNEPMKYDGIIFYQTDWSIGYIEGIFNKDNLLKISMKEVSLPDKSRFWVGIIPFSKNLLLVLQDLTGKCLIYTNQKKLLAETEIGHKIFINGESLQFTRFTPATGLQIKSDPGIGLVYIGFFFLIVSAVCSYNSHCQLWAVKQGDILYIQGNTNRALYFFEKNIGKILLQLITNNSKKSVKNLTEIT